jgi:type VII secretion integral membrane protein EccD
VAETVGANQCRITVRAPTKLVTLAVPTDVPWAEMLPSILRHAGQDLAESSVEHGGWVLQRLGEEPFDEEATATRSAVHDGETLYLRPLHDTLPPVHFDDLVDAVGSSMHERSGAWRPTHSRQVMLACAAAAAVVAAVLLGLGGPPAPRILAAAGSGLLSLVGAGLASRAGGDLSAGTVLGLCGVGHLALAGFLLIDGGQGQERLGARLLVACTAAVAASIVALAAVGAPAFLGLTLVGLAAMAGAVASAYGLALPRAAGVVAVLTVLLSSLVPALAFRLSGLRLPPLPANADELQEGIEPFPAGPVIASSAIADRYMTALYTSIGLLYALCLTALAAADSWSDRLLGAALSLLLLVHARGVGATWHRLASLVPGAYGFALLTVTVGAGLSDGRLVIVGAALAVTAALVVAALTVPGRRMLPYWGRAAEILHTTLAVAVVPLLLLDLGLFSFLRGMAG